MVDPMTFQGHPVTFRVQIMSLIVWAISYLNGKKML